VRQHLRSGGAQGNAAFRRFISFSIPLSWWVEALEEQARMSGINTRDNVAPAMFLHLLARASSLPLADGFRVSSLPSGPTEYKRYFVPSAL
jgi:hypothetical protein